MPRTANAKLKNATQRARLKVRANPHFETIAARRSLGYVRKSDTVAGCWIVRVEIGRTDTGAAQRRQQALGTADDLPGVYANGVDILSYEQARALAAKWQPEDSGAKVCTMRDACDQYRDHPGKDGVKLDRNRRSDHGMVRYHVLREHSDGTPREGKKGLGDIPVNELTTEMLQTLLDGIEGSPATKLRVSKATLSCLRQAYLKDSNGIVSDKAWERLPRMSQKNINRREVHYTIEEAHAIIEAARAIDAPVADYFEALFLTGARPRGELFALTVSDFNPALGQLSIQGRDEDTTSKTGERHISLDDGALALFTRLAAGKPSNAPLFSPDGERHWRANGDNRRIQNVLMRAGAPEGAVPYDFRHTFISRRLEQGMPAALVAKHCGNSIAMIERNYAKFLPSETRRWLNATAPKRPVLTLVKADEQQQEALQEAA